MTSVVRKDVRRKWAMNSLEQQLRESAATLQNAWNSVQQVPTTASLPTKCYEHWRGRAELHRTISGTIPLLTARSLAWKLVQEVSTSKPVKDRPNIVKYGAVDMDFAVARHLSFTSYVAVTWSIYDRIANVCGRLSGSKSISGNPKQNPKLCEELLGEKEDAKKRNTIGFAVHYHLQDAYSWPLKVSYKIRNWLVHEGYEEGSTPLFDGDSIPDGFQLHQDAVRHLQERCGYKEDEGKILFSCIDGTDKCWRDGNLLRILEQYHGEIDIMIGSLLKWSVDSFAGQIHVFAARDKV
jgi:hypothetical protein